MGRRAYCRCKGRPAFPLQGFPRTGDESPDDRERQAHAGGDQLPADDGVREPPGRGDICGRPPPGSPWGALGGGGDDDVLQCLGGLSDREAVDTRWRDAAGSAATGVAGGRASPTLWRVDVRARLARSAGSPADLHDHCRGCRRRDSSASSEFLIRRPSATRWRRWTRSPPTLGDLLEGGWRSGGRAAIAVQKRRRAPGPESNWDDEEAEEGLLDSRAGRRRSTVVSL